MFTADVDAVVISSIGVSRGVMMVGVSISPLEVVEVGTVVEVTTVDAGTAVEVITVDGGTFV